ncbi:XRE family transcriptional regulator [Lentibacillus sp. CBA3610]|nr:XRE family transcriptional regulator [Lentibacillus sp. CBA3610]
MRRGIGVDDEKLLQHFGQQVRYYRKQHDLKIHELAEELDISNNHLGRIERGESDTTITNLYRMAAILDIPDYFVNEMKKVVQSDDQ